MWRHGHVAEPTELEADAAAAYWAEVLRVGRAIAALWHPVKLNYMTLGNTVPHLHTHVVPRYREDPAPGAPLSWSQMVGDAPRPEVELQAQAAGLREVL